MSGVQVYECTRVCTCMGVKERQKGLGEVTGASVSKPSCQETLAYTCMCTVYQWQG